MKKLLSFLLVNRTFYLVILIIIHSSLIISCTTSPPPKPKVTHLTSYNCVYASTPIIIDGRMDDPAWEKAKTITEFSIPVTFDVPVQKSEAKLLWDDKYLYLAFRTYDQDIWGYFTKRDDATCREDVQEIFFQPDPQTGSYYNFEINVKGAALDAFHIREFRMGHRSYVWNCQGLKVATYVKGSLNNWRDKDEYWQMEVAIPFASLPTLDGKIPTNGDSWKFHLARYDYSAYLVDYKCRELVSCAPLTQCNFHYTKDWIPLIFTK